MAGISLEDKEIIEQYPKLTGRQVTQNYEQVLQILATNPPITPSTRLILEKYEGRGNQYTADTKIDEGLVHQFYTPYILTKLMWDLAVHYGYTPGKVLEPACGTGRFFKYAPEGSTFTGFDIDDSQTNTRITQLLYPDAKLYNAAFETAFMGEGGRSLLKGGKTWLEPQDIVIGNPPYGDYAGYFKNYMPKIYSRFEFLFVKLGLQCLRSGGLLIYLVSQNFMSNGSMYNGMKEDILKSATFIDAVRVPVGVFASTEIGTDIIIFRKK